MQGPLTGSSYVITGTLERLSREEATAALEALGAKVAGSVSSKTTGLIVGEEPGGSKVKGAQKHGTAILSEDELVALLGGEDALPAGDEKRQTLAPPPRRR